MVQQHAHQRLDVILNNLLLGLLQVGSYDHRSEVVSHPGAYSLWHWDHTGSLPQDWDFLQNKAQHRQACCLSGSELLKFLPHLVSTQGGGGVLLARE